LTPYIVTARTLLLAALIAFAGCARDRAPGSEEQSRADSVRADSLSRARLDSTNRTLPGYVVDSILPVEEELRRFRAVVGGVPASELKGGATSREALVSKFLKSLESNDTAALRSMLLTPREFADLVYPESPHTHPPYRQPPGLVWSMIQNAGSSGFTRLLRRLGGVALRHEGTRCEGPLERQGENTIMSRCNMRIAEPGGSIRSRRLFGSIIERHGRFKFVSYANEF
jgi:hypothetical protein